MNVLNEALATTRALTDEAVTAGEAGAALKLSRLASTLEKTVSYQRFIGEKYIARAALDRSAVELIEAYCAIAESVLPAEVFAVFEAAMSAALPSPIVDNEQVEALRKECQQVADLFASAVEASLVGDIARTGILLAAKAKALTKAEVHAGVLLDEGAARLLALPILDANRAARRAIGEEWHNAVVDVFAPLDPTGGQVDGE